MIHLDSPSAPHSTLERIRLAVLPPAIHRLLFSQSEEFQMFHVFLRVVFGGLTGTILFLGLFRRLPLTFDLQLGTGAIFVGVCVLAAVLSSSCRCSILLMFPSMLGSRGRAYLMVLTLSVLCTGPVANIQRNVEAATLSLGCNLDQQVRHFQLLWRHAIRPVVFITQALMDDKAAFQSEALNVSRRFQNIRDEVVLQYGYDRFTPNHPAATAAANSTQEQFTMKTLMQCDRVVVEGVQRCADWFSNKWAECMDMIPVPVINHILCVPMKFHFLCDVMRVMTPWCKDEIPVEGNFGQLFDQLNLSVDLLSREFSTRLVLQEHKQQSVLGEALLDGQFTRAVRDSIEKLRSRAENFLNALHLLLSLSFITIFTQSFGYLRRYGSDVRFDNVYITTYFRQIDSRRRRAGKNTLLPLKGSEKKKFIDPWSPKVHSEELQQLISGVFQVLSLSLLTVTLLSVDFALFHVLDIVSRHTFTHFNLTSNHRVDISVGGDSMMARLLRKTVSVFNSSSSLNIQTDNLECVSPPSSLSAHVYVRCLCCVLMVALFSCLQVYTNRLRRVIAAFYYPKREKKRVLFLYNLLIQRRKTSVGRKHIISRGRRIIMVCGHLSRWWCSLCGHQKQEVPDSEEAWYDPG